MFKRILVALDGSPASNAGLKTAVQLALDQQALLYGLHVIDDSQLSLGFYAEVPVTTLQEVLVTMREEGRKTVQKAEAVALASGVILTPLIIEAQGQAVARAIVQQARKLKADLIVLGTHGRRGLRRVLMGSDAEAVLRDANVPVLLIRHPKRARPGPRAASGAPASTKRPRRTSSRAEPVLP